MKAGDLILLNAALIGRALNVPTGWKGLHPAGAGFKENRMIATDAATIIPKLRRGHHSYDESLDEPAKLIEAEPVAIENEGPSGDSRPIENIDESKEKESSAFEE